MSERKSLPVGGISPHLAVSILRSPDEWTADAVSVAHVYAADRIALAHGNRAESRRVVCAACKLEDGTFVLGARHMDGAMYSTFHRLNKEWLHAKDAQGFIDQHGVFMSRQEAWKVAEAAGQILYRAGGDTIDGGYLFSENLY